MTYGILEVNLVGKERYRGIGIGARCSIFKVAFDWRTYRGKLTTNLVMPTGKELHVQKGIVFGFC